MRFPNLTHRLSFRSRLFGGLLVVALVTAVSSSVLGYLSFRQALNDNTTSTFETVVSLSQSMIDFSGASPRLQLDRQSNALLQSLGEVRFRLRSEERNLLFYGGSYPEADSNWRTASFELETAQEGQAFQLDVALNMSDTRAALQAYLRSSWLTLVVALLIAGLLGGFLYQLALQPIRDLTWATKVLSQQRIPDEIIVPEGRDELSQLATSFNRMSRSLMGFIQRERAFTRYASHELRTPLANLKVLFEGVARGLYTQQELEAQAPHNIQQMQDIIEGLLMLTRSSTRQLEPILVSPVVTASLHAFDDASMRRIRLINHTDDDLVILGRDELIQQLIHNLLTNALKYSDAEVRLELTHHHTDICMCVLDQGRGEGQSVPEAKLSELTEPFVRHHTEQEGLGLGLALVQHIVDTLQGSLRLRNLEPGFEVRVCLPLVTDEDMG
ncbi:MAG: HAMP domain-containing sensor histidine kinase [Deinococcota bacterium]